MTTLNPHAWMVRKEDSGVVRASGLSYEAAVARCGEDEFVDRLEDGETVCIDCGGVVLPDDRTRCEECRIAWVIEGAP